MGRGKGRGWEGLKPPQNKFSGYVADEDRCALDAERLGCGEGFPSPQGEGFEEMPLLIIFLSFFVEADKLSENLKQK